MLPSLLRELTKHEPISVSEYVRLCLYHPEWGYYIKPRTRVGADGDFYTSSTLKGGVFAKLLLGSAKKLGGNSLGIVEIGAEPGRALFPQSAVCRVGDEISLQGNIFLFSNELLDAQPFDRFKFENGQILKTFVKFLSEGAYELGYKPASEYEFKVLEKYFTFNHDVFHLDFSFDALNLFKKICSQTWNGVLLFADYFRTRAELADFPHGTARAYVRHKAKKDIFLSPGQADITFSPPFEDFADILHCCGFSNVSCETQAKFFFESAQSEIRAIVESAGVFSDEKRALSELISPVHLGDNFRILAGVRRQQG